MVVREDRMGVGLWAARVDDRKWRETKTRAHTSRARRAPQESAGALDVP